MAAEDVDVVVIAVPTYRRPKGLERCLDAIEALDCARPIHVVVSENDVDGKEGLAVCDRIRARGYRFPLTTILVPERGIAAVRNRLVRQALTDPDVRWIAMIDDDEWPRNAWLSELLRVQQAFEADIVGGPVQRSYEVPPPPHVLSASEGAYGALETGCVDLVDATSNILFVASLFRQAPEPWFDPVYALLGGEDRDFLIGQKLAGRRFAWAKDAVVHEDYPASRCSVGWMVRRAYRGGNTDMLINLKYRPPSFTVLKEGSKILGAVGLSLLDLTLLAWSPKRRILGLLLMARQGGKIAGLFGMRYNEYRVVHGS